MKKEQVVYLNLWQFRFPITAIVSILHRLSGVLLFLSIPAVLWALQKSLASEPGLDYVKDGLQHCFLVQLTLWVFLSAMFYHLVAGIRHILMDVCIGDSKKGGRLGAYLVMAMSGIFTVLAAGVILW